MALKDQWDTQAIKAGASVAVFLAVPPSLIARFMIDDTDTNNGWAPLLSLLAIFGFIIGSGQAAWRQRKGTPILHGMLTSTGVFVAAQFVFAIVKLAMGDELRFMRIVTSFSLAMFAGLIGGLLGYYLQRNGPAPKPLA
ncbi:MAG: hypothetical protein EBU84_06340 [Actinobacteria bacterium]|jgi:putative membrane protein (TIGR04086 family)|nr:hypothetical protein [Actinomycetota bacterium]